MSFVEIREGEDFLEVLHTETSPPGTPAAGDLRFSVRVLSAGFAGQSPHVWVDAESFRRFISHLQELDSRRQGIARLEAVGSPDEFWLELRAIDRAGHLAAFGRLCQWQYLRGQGYRQAVEFGFEVCPSLLPGILTAFRSMEHCGAS
jgi:hypothetical protein